MMIEDRQALEKLQSELKKAHEALDRAREGLLYWDMDTSYIDDIIGKRPKYIGVYNTIYHPNQRSGA